MVFIKEGVKPPPKYPKELLEVAAEKLLAEGRLFTGLLTVSLEKSRRLMVLIAGGIPPPK